MKRLLVQSGSAFALLALTAVTLAAAPVTGRVSFNLNRGQKPVTNETLVWLEPAAGARALRRAAPVNVTMTTRGKTLLPHVLAIPVGSNLSGSALNSHLPFRMTWQSVLLQPSSNGRFESLLVQYTPSPVQRVNSLPVFSVVLQHPRRSHACSKVKAFLPTKIFRLRQITPALRMTREL